MRILFITAEYPRSGGECGGVGSYVASIGPLLAARGHEVHVLSCMDEQEPEDWVDHGVYVHGRGVIGNVGHRGINRILKTPATFEAFRSGLTSYIQYFRLGLDVDVIEYPDLDAAGWVFALIHKKPLVAHIHLPIIMWYPADKMPMTQRDVRWASALEQFAIRHADKMTCPSKLLVRILNKKGWLKGRDCRVIPPCIYGRDWFNTPPVGNTQPIVLFLGWLGLNKAPEILVEAIALIRRKLPEAKACFLGASLEHREGIPYLEWIKKSTPNLSGCEFVGYIPRHRVIDFVSSCRVLAMPSWFENYPMAALEAMAAGRPIVVTKNSGVAELVEKTGAGRVIPPGNPKALTEALLPFLMETAFAAEAGDRAREAVRHFHDPEKVAVQREMVYQHAIASFKAGRRRSSRIFESVE